jgi:hypothetical protein
MFFVNVVAVKRRDGDGTSMLSKVPDPLINIAHFKRF